MDEAWGNLATAAVMHSDWTTGKMAVDKLQALNSPAYGDALKLLQSAQTAATAVRNDPKAKEAEQFFAKGEALFKEGEFDKAISAYRQAVKRQPKNANYWCGLGAAYGRKGELKDAFNCFSETVKLDPSHSDGWRNLGVAFKVQGKLREAKNAAEQATRIDPSNALACNDLGVLVMDAGNYQQAVVCFQAAVKNLPSYDLAWRNLGVALCALGKDVEARQILTEMQRRGSPLASEVASALAKTRH